MAVALEHAATPNTLSSRAITGTNPEVDAGTRPDTPGPAVVSTSTATAPGEEQLSAALPDEAVADRAAQRDTVTSTP